MRLPRWCADKNLPAVQEIWVQSPGGKIPWSAKWLHTPVFLSGRFLGQRSLVRYSPWDQSQTQLSDWARTHQPWDADNSMRNNSLPLFILGEPFIRTCLLFYHQNSLFNLFDYLSWIIPLLKHENVAVKLFVINLESLFNRYKISQTLTCSTLTWDTRR